MESDSDLGILIEECQCKLQVDPMNIELMELYRELVEQLHEETPKEVYS